MLTPSIGPALIFDHAQAVAGVGVLLIVGTAVAFVIAIRKRGFVRATSWLLAAGWGVLIWAPVLAGLVFIAPYWPVVTAAGLALFAVVLTLFVLAVRRYGVERAGGWLFAATWSLVIGVGIWFARQVVTIDPGPDAPLQIQSQPDTPGTK